MNPYNDFSNYTYITISPFYITTKHQKYKIAYIPLNPVANYVYIADLIIKLRVGWKTLPN